MNKKEEVDRRSGKPILKSGQGWALWAQLGQLRIGQKGIVVKSSVAPQPPCKVMR